MKWRRVEPGHYETDDGAWSIESSEWIDGATEALTTYRATEWFLYDRGGNMVDGYPTLRAAKAAAEVVGARR